MPDFKVPTGEIPYSVETVPEMNTHDDKDYGCIFCITGRESVVAQRLERAFPGLKAVSHGKLRYRRMNGTSHEERVPLFPGYVFIEVQSATDIELRNIYNDQDVLKILYVNDENKDWKLLDPDRRVVKQCFDMNGVIGFSKAYFDEDNRIHIAEGFLKDYEDKISRVNRRARAVQIHLIIGNKQAKVWLGYEEMSR